MSQIEWTNDTVLKLIHLYKSCVYLWDISDADYKNRSKKPFGWKIIADQMNCAPSQIEKKIHSLRSQFKREHNRMVSTKSIGGTPYKSAWFAYKHLMFTLKGSRTRRLTETTNEEEQQNYDGDWTEHFGNNDDIGGVIHKQESFARESIGQPHEKKYRAPQKRTRQQLEDCLDEAYSVIKSNKYADRSRDEFSVYGEHVANELRKIRDDHARSVIQHLINNTIFDGQMGKYNKSGTSSNHNCESLYNVKSQSITIATVKGEAISPNSGSTVQSPSPSHQLYDQDTQSSFQSFQFS